MSHMPSHLQFLRSVAVSSQALPGGFRLGEFFRMRFAKQDKEILLSDFDENLKFFVNLSDHIGGQVFWHGHYSVDQLLLAHKIIKPTDVVFDIGANIGEFSIYVAKRVTQGFLHSFEPTQKLFAIAKKNLEVNNFKNAAIYKIGFSDKAAELEIYKVESRGADGAVNNGLNSMFKGESFNSSEIISVLKMDDWCERNKIDKIDFIKMDIEGAELFALKGGANTIRRLRPKMIIEVNEKTCLRAGYTPRELVDFIVGLGYQIHNIDRMGHSSPAIDLSNVSRDILCLPK